MFVTRVVKKFTQCADTVSDERLHNNPVEYVKLDLT